MKHHFYFIAILCLLAGCTGSISHEKTAAQADSFYSSPAAHSDEGKEYLSTGDASLLDVKLPAGTENETLPYKAITVYYNNRLRVPNCVAYELTNTQVAMADAPDAEKRGDYNFNRDEQVKGCPDWWEYKDTGYDRGHMAPAMDMRWDKTAMEQCFLMTNICPQNHELNDGEWRHMEEAVHTWARRTARLVIFTGPVFGKEMSLTGKRHNIAVPSHFFKVVYAPEQQRAIAFLFRNERANKSWTNYAVTIDEVERLTGIDFLSSLPDETETAIESRQNIKNWPRYTPRR